MTDLLELAQRVAGQAAPGEQVEAFVGQGTSTSVRVHGGEIESLTQASSAGIGIRVVKDKRQGFAWAGSLDDVGHRRRAGRGPRQRGLRRARGVDRPGRARRGRAARHRPVARRAGRRAHQPQGRPGHGARAGREGARPPHRGRAHVDLGRRLGRGGGRHLDGHRRGRPVDLLPRVGAGAGRGRRRRRRRATACRWAASPATSTWPRRPTTRPSAPPACWARSSPPAAR